MFLYVKAIVCKSVGSVSNLCVKSQLCVRHVCMYQHACMQKCMSHVFFLCLLRFILLFFLLQFLYTYLLFTTRLRHVFSFHASSYISIFTFHATRSSYLYLSLCSSTLSGHPSSSFSRGWPYRTRMFVVLVFVGHWFFRSWIFQLMVKFQKVLTHGGSSPESITFHNLKVCVSYL